MNPEDVHKAIADSIEKVVPIVVERVVNEEVKAIRETLDAHVENVKPLVEFVQMLNTLNKFLKWGGLTFFAFMGIVYFLIRKA